MDLLRSVLGPLEKMDFILVVMRFIGPRIFLGYKLFFFMFCLCLYTYKALGHSRFFSMIYMLVTSNTNKNLGFDFAICHLHKHDRYG